MVKRWLRHKAYLARGDWHVHTHWTDGENSVFEYCHQAEKNGLELIAFTEHVRRKMDYDFRKLASEVEEARKRFNLIILLGCEAKVLNQEGELDVSREILDVCDIVLGSFHSFPHPAKYLVALENLLRNPEMDIWAHPTLFCQRNQYPLSNMQLKRLIDLSRQENVLVEFNFKYHLPLPPIKDFIIKNNIPYVFGSDAHGIKELLTQKQLPSQVSIS